MKGYLEGYAFTVTDHQSLKWLQRLDSTTGRLGRWVFELQQYEYDVKYRSGKLNRVADALSRYPEVCAAQTERCTWYRRTLNTVTQNPTALPDYRVDNGVLYRHILHSLNFKDEPADRQWKRCVPREQRPEILRQLHDAPTAGHLEVAKTLARIAAEYYWPDMLREIATYVRQCGTCMAHKAL